MKTLIVQYTPREEHSTTKILLDTFLQNCRTECEILDLTKTVPEFFFKDTLNILLKRNHGGAILSAEELALVEPFDRLTQQFVDADALVMAFPMYNFSLPGIVKTYIDCVAQRKQTWDMDDSGNFVGLMKGKRALVLMSCGGVYEQEPFASWEHCLTLSRTLLKFLGFDPIETVSVQGTTSPEQKELSVEKATPKVKAIAKTWA